MYALEQVTPRIPRRYRLLAVIFRFPDWDSFASSAR